MDFDAASKVHFDWKAKLRNYLQKPDQSLDPATIGSGSQCVLGKWIQSEGSKHSADAAFQELRKEHANFHRVAGDLVRRANQGEMVEEEAALGSTSPFNHASQRVTTALMDMKRKAMAPARG